MDTGGIYFDKFTTIYTQFRILVNSEIRRKKLGVSSKKTEVVTLSTIQKYRLE